MSPGPDPLAVYLEVLFGRSRPATLVEVRWRTARGMGRQFVPVPDRSLIADVVRRWASVTDVYVGVLARWRAAGDRRAVVGDGRVVWVDLDTENAARALEPVDPAPAMTVASGGRGHLHAYWVLSRAVPPGVIERANRRLAWALGGDLASTDAARILRPASTLHHGHDRAPVTLRSVSTAGPCRLGPLIGGFADPPAASPRTRRPVRGSPSRHDPLLAVAPQRYVSVLTGQPVGPSRKVRCPLHDDRTASLHAYLEPERGWFCFGCRRGGSVYDLAAAIWRVQPRGEEFCALQVRLRELLI